MAECLPEVRQVERVADEQSNVASWRNVEGGELAFVRRLGSWMKGGDGKKVGDRSSRWRQDQAKLEQDQAVQDVDGGYGQHDAGSCCKSRCEVEVEAEAEAEGRGERQDEEEDEDEDEEERRRAESLNGVCRFTVAGRAEKSTTLHS